MTKFMAATLATALTATMAIASVAPASAASASVQFSFGQRDRVVTQYCDRNRNDRDCRDFRSNHGRWSSNDYNRFYGRHRTGLDGLASGLFGFTFGAIIGGAIANSHGSAHGGNSMSNMDSGHFTRCEARFHSYSRSSDSYLGTDGQRHSCDL